MAALIVNALKGPTTSLAVKTFGDMIERSAAHPTAPCFIKGAVPVRMPLLSRVLFCFVSIYLVVGAHIADFSRTHLLNPRWPPHARFHDGQTLMFSIFLAALTIYFASSKTQDRALTVASTTSFAALYWVTQAMAILYPGTAFMDPEFDRPGAYLLGLPAQVVIDILALALISFAAFYAARKPALWRG